jgi:hypothetical protein
MVLFSEQLPNWARQIVQGLDRIVSGKVSKIFSKFALGIQLLLWIMRMQKQTYMLAENFGWINGFTGCFCGHTRKCQRLAKVSVMEPDGALIRDDFENHGFVRRL